MASTFLFRISWSEVQVFSGAPTKAQASLTRLVSSCLWLSLLTKGEQAFFLPKGHLIIISIQLKHLGIRVWLALTAGFTDQRDTERWISRFNFLLNIWKGLVELSLLVSLYITIAWNCRVSAINSCRVLIFCASLSWLNFFKDSSFVTCSYGFMLMKTLGQGWPTFCYNRAIRNFDRQAEGHMFFAFRT